MSIADDMIDDIDFGCAPYPPERVGVADRSGTPLRQVIIMRGLPGSGKSTRAREIHDILTDLGLSVTVRSTDDQFMVDGVYRFDPAKISLYHLRNQTLAERDLSAGVNVVIIDNTNSQRWEMEPYERMAKRHGVPVRIITVGEFTPEAVSLYALRNTHGVLLDAVRRMAKRFEA